MREQIYKSRRTINLCFSLFPIIVVGCVVPQIAMPSYPMDQSHVISLAEQRQEQDKEATRRSNLVFLVVVTAGSLGIAGSLAMNRLSPRTAIE